jgi:predicted ribonuclease toxin of YeeF-YezG toxin-antitoxin module
MKTAFELGFEKGAGLGSMVKTVGSMAGRLGRSAKGLVTGSALQRATSAVDRATSSAMNAARRVGATTSAEAMATPAAKRLSSLANKRDMLTWATPAAQVGTGIAAGGAAYGGLRAAGFGGEQ